MPPAGGTRRRNRRTNGSVNWYNKTVMGEYAPGLIQLVIAWIIMTMI